MKIARTLTVSERHVEWYGLFPAPSLRELSSECETEGVYSGERNRSKISEPKKSLCVNHWSKATIGRHSLSQPFGLPAPSEREPGWGPFHSTGYSLKSNVTGDFHRPYGGVLHFTIHQGAIIKSAFVS